MLETRLSKIFWKTEQTEILTSFEDFCARVDLGTINKKTMESLIKAGAMDLFGKRAKLLIDFPDIVDSSSKKEKTRHRLVKPVFWR